MTAQSLDLPNRLFGLTVDNVTDEVLPKVIDALKKIKGRSRTKPVVRVVFDFDEKIFEEKKYHFRPEDFRAEVKGYYDAIVQLRPYASIMGELIDSSAVYRCHYDPSPVRTYEARTTAYVEGLKDVVDVWEIGNEINGEWVGWLGESWRGPNITVEQMADVRNRTVSGLAATYRTLKQIKPDALTALTFYYNSDTVNHGWTDDEKFNADGVLVKYGHYYDMLEWAGSYRRQLPDVDYVFLSYYEDDNEGVLPNRENMDVSGLVKSLVSLARMFGKAQFGFGEFAPQCNFENCCKRKCRACANAQISYISRYYIDLDKIVRDALADPRSGWDRRRVYVGGYFYWYFNSDVVNNNYQDTLDALKKAFTQYTVRR